MSPYEAISEATIRRLQARIVGRSLELQLLVSALKANRPVLLVGAPGTSKTTLLRNLVDEVNAQTGSTMGIFSVTGDEQLTAHALVGTFDPSMVLKAGYHPDHFVFGPLARAMQSGGILYIEELNRAPASSLNVLLTTLSDGYVDVPHFGRITAAPGFSVVGSSNPLDDVGTERLSRAILDRFVVIAVEYQSREEELDIVRLNHPGWSDQWIELAVDLVRHTRNHPDVRYGASIRGAIDFLGLLNGLWLGDTAFVREAAVSALIGRIVVKPSSERTAREIILEILSGLRPPQDPGPGEKWAVSGRASSQGESQGAGVVQPGGNDGPEWARGGEILGELHQPPTIVDLAWRGGQGGVRGQSHQSPQTQHPGLQFGTTMETGLITGRRQKPWIDWESARRWAWRFPGRLALGSVPRGSGRRGRPVSVPWSANPTGVLDTMATLYAMVNPPDGENIIRMRGKQGIKRRLALLIDHSGSMAGAKLAIAIGVVTAMAQHSREESVEYGVYVFDQQVSVVKPLAEPYAYETVVDRLLHLPEGRSTDLSAALRYGRTLGDRFSDLEVLLISDCVPTRGERDFHKLARLAKGVPKLYICQIPHGGGLCFENPRHSLEPRLDLYGLWALRWVGPDRFCTVGSLEDMDKPLRLLGHVSGWL